MSGEYVIYSFMIETHVPKDLIKVIGGLKGDSRPTPALLTEFNGAMWGFLTSLPGATQQPSVNVPEFPLSQSAVEDLRCPYPQIFVYQPAVTSSEMLALMTRLARGSILRDWRSPVLQEQEKNSRGMWVCVDSGIVPPYLNQNEDRTMVLLEEQDRVLATAMVYITASRFFQYATTIFYQDVAVGPGKSFDIMAPDPRTPSRIKQFRSRLLETPSGSVITVQCDQDDVMRFSNVWEPQDRNGSLGARSMQCLSPQ